MRKIFYLFLIICFLTSTHAMSDVLPNLSSFFDVAMPSLRLCTLSDPVSEEICDDGSRKLIFDGVTAEIYDDFAEYLSDAECLLVEYTVSDDTISAIIAKEEWTFTFEYNYKTLQATVIYPEGTIEEHAYISKNGVFRVGSYVTFGLYPQTYAGTDKTAIEWLVLDVQSNKALLISKYGLDAKPYNTEFTSVTWETCTLRKWLNSDFYNKAFSKTEQKAILTTKVDNSRSQRYIGYKTSGGENTYDKIFLLSYAEANKYFGIVNKNTKSRVQPTAYAIAQGAYASNSNKTSDGAEAGWWWLRSPGYDSCRAARVYSGGLLQSSDVNRINGVVRPALWVDLSLIP